MFENIKLDQLGYETPKGDFYFMGFNFKVKNGVLQFNMFDINENDPLDENNVKPKMGDNIWNISDYVLKNLFNNAFKRSEVNWSFTSRHQTTDIKFNEIDNKPYSIELTNNLAFDGYDNNTGITQEWYEANYYEVDDKPRHKSDMVRERRIEPPQEPTKQLCIPCPQAKDGVFYAKLNGEEGFESDDYISLVVDTQKLIARIEKDDPEMLVHAKRKFKFDTVEQWLEGTSITNPRDMGNFVLGQHVGENNKNGGIGLTMGSGMACMLELAQQLELPFMPIRISKYGHNGLNDPQLMQMIKDLESDIGFKQSVNNNMKPTI